MSRGCRISVGWPLDVLFTPASPQFLELLSASVDFQHQGFHLLFCFCFSSALHRAFESASLHHSRAFFCENCASHHSAHIDCIHNGSELGRTACKDRCDHGWSFLVRVFWLEGLDMLIGWMEGVEIVELVVTRSGIHFPST